MSHFTVLVKIRGKEHMDNIEWALHDILESYSENLEVEPYPDENLTPERIQQDLGDLIQRICSNDCPDYLESYKKNKDLLKKVFWEMKDNWEEFLKNEQLLDKFNKVYENYYGKPLESDGKMYTTYNPESKWDWWSIGGRWSGQFILKDGATGLEGSPGVFDNKTGIDVALAKDIDWDKMKEINKEAATENYHNSKEKPFSGVLPDESLEDYLDRISRFYTYAVLDEEEGWHERGRMGWFACVYDADESEEEWAKKFEERFLKDLDDDIILVVVDCHI